VSVGWQQVPTVRKCLLDLSPLVWDRKRQPCCSAVGRETVRRLKSWRTELTSMPVRLRLWSMHGISTR